jgi:hypothetical protein
MILLQTEIQQEMVYMDKETENEIRNRKRKMGVSWTKETSHLVTTKFIRRCGEEMKLSSPQLTVHIPEKPL